MVEKAFEAMCKLETEDEEINYEDVSIKFLFNR